MTVKEAIERSGAQLTSGGGEAVRYVCWLRELEARLNAEIYGIDRAPVLTENSILSAPEAYADIYPLYLMMKRELLTGDAARYGLYRAELENAFGRYLNFVTRRMPVTSVYIKTL